MHVLKSLSPSQDNRHPELASDPLYLCTYMQDQGASGNTINRLVKESCEGEKRSIPVLVFLLRIHTLTLHVTVPPLKHRQTLPHSSHRVKHSTYSLSDDDRKADIQFSDNKRPRQPFTRHAVHSTLLLPCREINSGPFCCSRVEGMHHSFTAHTFCWLLCIT